MRDVHLAVGHTIVSKHARVRALVRIDNQPCLVNSARYNREGLDANQGGSEFVNSIYYSKLLCKYSLITTMSDEEWQATSTTQVVL